MEFTEEEIAHSLMNVSEDRRVRALETFRRLKRDMDAFEDDLRSMGVTRRAFARSSVAQALDPELWSALPLELVHLVFARLPLVDMIRLRALSTTWNRYVSGDMPGFTKVCAEVNPKLFGLIGDGSEVYEDGQMAVMLPGSGTSWHKYGCTPPMEGYVDTMRAGDGGLVCIVSLSKSARQDPRIVVHNPLTCRNRALPRLPWHMQSARFSMVQLVMDRDPKCYKVLVLCYRGQSLHASVFCSITGRWRGPEAPDGLVFGYRHDWNRGFLNDPDTAYPSSRNPCFYDCSSGELADLDDRAVHGKHRVCCQRVAWTGSTCL